MIIRRYVVKDMKEALVRAKYELGKDAVIVSQRMIKQGRWFNPFKKKVLEVTVAIEDEMVLEVKKVPVESKTTVETKAIDTDERLLMDTIDKDPFFKDCDLKIKEQLISYCKLHDKKDYYLTLEEKKDFFNIVLRQGPAEKRVELSKINVLIGPTGVGKTTTIAKIAAKEYLENKKKVGLITIDTYRIGAVEQLRTYANILGIPFEVANKPEDMKEKIKLLDHCDVILVDTLGTSPKDLKKQTEIKNHLETIEHSINTYLVFSISTDMDTINSIIKKYKVINYDALIITKMDEVYNISNLLIFLKDNTIPIQYFCHGQDVPDDIQLATLDNIFSYCEENFQYDRSSK